MPNPYFRFKQFTVFHDRSAMKVTTDACLFGAWCAEEMGHLTVHTALDIGTGTGLLSLMVAQKNKVQIDAVELETGAAEQAAENIQASPWPGQIRIHQGDIRTYQTTQAYDCVFSNPPFYEKEIKAKEDRKNMAHHGSSLLLGELLPRINNLLHPNGTFFLLLPAKRWGEVQRLFASHQLYLHKLVFVRQSTRHEPFRLLVTGKLTPPVQTEETQLSICTEHQQYTEEFKQLLQDYYLYL